MVNDVKASDTNTRREEAGVGGTELGGMTRRALITRAALSTASGFLLIELGEQLFHPKNAVAQSSQPLGVWEVVYDPVNDPVPGKPRIVGIHTVLLHTGKVLMFWHGSLEDTPGGMDNISMVASTTGANGQPLIQTKQYMVMSSPFCSGHAILADGRVVVAGGHAHDATSNTSGHDGTKALRLFTPQNDPNNPGVWGCCTQGDFKMVSPRWYPTCAILPDGRMFIISGTTKCDGPIWTKQFINSTYEIFDDTLPIGANVQPVPLYAADKTAGGTFMCFDPDYYHNNLIYGSNWSPQNPAPRGDSIIGNVHLNSADASGLWPLRRLYNTSRQDHLFIADPNDIAVLTNPANNLGFVEENEFYGYVFRAPGAGRKPMHRFWNATQGKHYFTTDQTKYNQYINNPQFQYQGADVYLLANGVHDFLRSVGSYFTYPFVFVLPSGKLFLHAGTKTRFLDLATGDLDSHERLSQSTGTEPGGTAVLELARTYPVQGTSVLLPLRPSDNYTARILMIGGGQRNPSALPDLHDNKVATASCEMLTLSRDPNVAPGQWQPVASLPVPRLMCDGVLLPDGTVLVVNGTRVGQPLSGSDPVKSAALYKPTTNQWVTLSSSTIGRMYHSTALLLPDATVLVAGHDEINDYGTVSPTQKGPFDYNEFRIEIFRPPYLFAGARPEITVAPAQVTYGETFTVDVYIPDGKPIVSAAFIHPGSVTHSFDMAQRHVELQIVSQAPLGRDPLNKQLTLQAPPDANIAQPGHYMLFLLKDAQYGDIRVPSEAKFVALNPNVPLFRVEKPGGGYLVTTSTKEVNRVVPWGWTNLGIFGYGYRGSCDAAGLVPLYRLFNPNTVDHLYTADPAHRDDLIANHGYQYECIQCYIYPPSAPPPGGKGVFRAYDTRPSVARHIFVDEARYNTLESYYWRQGVIAYVRP